MEPKQFEYKGDKGVSVLSRWLAIAAGLVMLFFSGCLGGVEGQHLESRNGFAVISSPEKGEAIATFAGGCFWAMQECMVELKGVNKVISGYAGGTTEHPSYTQVSSKNTGHAESVQVYYDPKVITFEQLVKVFFYAHDPTELNRQGPDVGTDYRSIAFFRSPEEYHIITKVMREVQGEITGKMPVVTEVLPFRVIYPAETEHQDYYKRHQLDTYIRNVSKPKVEKLKKVMPALIKPEYQG
ncbi:peptide-methionine (S)-S-oxide reductase MsrA [Pedobacter sp. BAL39]|uniref:peptide-methionine (S)-S-oxide reductase MsrA n=1 Tax=Pedobacter sp. BAL39 TaxID=391596 RepID=UPI0018DC255A|nr:peptide-methionine (S)-S-oxide reductase MsrA [Pedobacter sp. BAL39]